MNGDNPAPESFPHSTSGVPARLHSQVGAADAQPGPPTDREDSLLPQRRERIDERGATREKARGHRPRDQIAVHGTWILHETGPDGRQVRRDGRNTETARQQSDGRWLFVIDNPSVPQD